MVVEGNGRADSITIGVCVMEKKVGGILPPFGSRTLVFFSFSSSSLLFFWVVHVIRERMDMAV